MYSCHAHPQGLRLGWMQEYLLENSHVYTCQQTHVQISIDICM